jgi:hypothetical protein
MATDFCSSIIITAYMYGIVLEILARLNGYSYNRIFVNFLNGIHKLVLGNRL